MNGRDPLSPGAYDGLGDALRVAGQPAEAEAAYRHALVVSPQDYWAHTYLGMVLLELGKPDAALAEIQQSNNESFRLWGLTIVYFAMRDLAFEWFGRAFRQHDPAVTWLKVGLLWRNVHSDPRYAEWLGKLDLPE